MHTVIVGNGIIALTAAYRLAHRSSATDRITIIGKDARPGSATLAAAAMLNSFAEIEVGALDAELDLYRFELSHMATRMWPKFVMDIIRTAGSRLPPDCANCQGTCGGCFGLGTYIVNNAAADDLDDENFDAIVAALKNFDEPFDFVTPSDIPNYMPEQRYRATRALYIPNEGFINPRLLIQAVEAALRAFPFVEFVEGEVDLLTFDGSSINRAVLTDGRTIEGDKFLLATGATVGNLIDKSKLGIDVQRIFYGVGVSVEIKSPDYPHTKCIRTPNRGLACGVYSAPYFTKDSILIGASNFISPVPYDYGRLTSVESLLRAAIEQINRNFYRADLVRINVGWRPTSQDTYPLVGKTSIKNLVIATGTKRDGIHLSPLLSEKIASMLLDEPDDERFLVFHPERKLAKVLSREAAIEKSVRHLISASYQHGFSPSKDRMPERIAKMHRDDLERLHDQVGASDWGIPPEMIDMYRYGHAVG